jgi:hypothetical protein
VVGLEEKILTDEQWKALKYKNTTVKKATTKGEITGLLETNNIENYSIGKINGVETVMFPIKVSRNGIDYALVIKVTVPRICYNTKKGKGRYAKKEKVYYEDVSWRVTWWYLKSKLEAIEYGVSDMMTEFMFNAFHVLPDGREVKLSEVVANNLGNLDKVALPDNSQRKYVDAEVTKVDQ